MVRATFCNCNIFPFWTPRLAATGLWPRDQDIAGSLHCTLFLCTRRITRCNIALWISCNALIAFIWLFPSAVCVFKLYSIIVQQAHYQMPQGHCTIVYKAPSTIWWQNRTIEEERDLCYDDDFDKCNTDNDDDEQWWWWQWMMMMISNFLTVCSDWMLGQWDRQGERERGHKCMKLKKAGTSNWDTQANTKYKIEIVYDNDVWW